VYDSGCTPAFDATGIHTRHPYTGHLLRDAAHGQYPRRKRCQRRRGENTAGQNSSLMTMQTSLQKIPRIACVDEPWGQDRKTARGFVRSPIQTTRPLLQWRQEENFYALQFHPEVIHTVHGKKILKNFLFNICDCRPTWTMKSFIETAKREIKTQTAEKSVVCGISGG